MSRVHPLRALGAASAWQSVARLGVRVRHARPDGAREEVAVAPAWHHQYGPKIPGTPWTGNKRDAAAAHSAMVITIRRNAHETTDAPEHSRNRGNTTPTKTHTETNAPHEPMQRVAFEIPRIEKRGLHEMCSVDE